MNTPNVYGLYPLHDAVFSDGKEFNIIFAYTTNHNVKNDDGDTPVMYASDSPDVDILRKLLSVLDLNHQNHDGDNIVSYCLQNYFDCDKADRLRLILSHGAKIDIPNNVGNTPLSIAEQSCSQDCIDALRTYL